MTQRICKHMVACPHGPCDMAPCEECGALCPNSTWTPKDDIHEFDQALDDMKRHADRLFDRVKKYRDWKATA